MLTFYVIWSGKYKTWTLDSGLDYGLDCGLTFGLGIGPSYTAKGPLFNHLVTLVAMYMPTNNNQLGCGFTACSMGAARKPQAVVKSIMEQTHCVRNNCTISVL